MSALDTLDGFLQEQATNGATDQFDQIAAAIEHIESKGQPNAISKQGARGKMQILRGTFNDYALPGEDFNNDDDRTSAALRKLRDDYDYYGGDVRKTAAAYIGGRGGVRADGTLRDDVHDAEGTSPLSYADMIVGRMGQAGTQPSQPAMASGTPEPDMFDAMLAAARTVKLPATPPAQAGMMRTVGDVGVKLAQGAVGLGSALTGLGSLATGGLVGKGMRAIGYDPQATNEALGQYLSDSQKASDAKVQQADGFVDAVIASIENPRAILGGIAESAPGMMAGMGLTGAVARGIALKAALATTEGAAASAAALSAGKTAAQAGAEAVASTGGKKAASAAIEAARNKLLAIGAASEGAQGAGQIADDAQAKGRAYGDYALPALAAGTITAGIGFGSNKVFGDAATDLATGTRTLEGSLPAKIGKQMFSEGLVEEATQSGQEKYFTNIAQGEPDHMQGVGNAAGTGAVVGAVMGGGMAALSGANQAAPENPPGTPPGTPPTIDPTLPPAPLPANAGPLVRAQHAAATKAAQEAAASKAAAAARVANSTIDYERIALPTTGNTGPVQAEDPLLEPMEPQAPRPVTYENGIRYQPTGPITPPTTPAAPASYDNGINYVDPAMQAQQQAAQDAETAHIETQRQQEQEQNQADIDAGISARQQQEDFLKYQKIKRDAEHDLLNSRLDSQQAAQQAQTRNDRSDILDTTLSSVGNASIDQKLAAFSANLKRQGYRNTAPTTEEAEYARRHAALAETFNAPAESIPSTPNELVDAVPERAAPAKPAKAAKVAPLPQGLRALAEQSKDVTAFFKGLNKIKNAQGEHVYPQNQRKPLTAAFNAILQERKRKAAFLPDTAPPLPEDVKAVGQDRQEVRQDRQEVGQDAATSAKPTPPLGENLPTPAAEPTPPLDTTGQFDSQAWDKARDDTIKASKKAGNTHLDTVPVYVETMRGKPIYYAHDPKERGVVRTVDNRGAVLVYWSDDYSAKKNSATEVKEGKKTVFQSWLMPSDLKDYVFEKAAPSAKPEAATPVTPDESVSSVSPVNPAPAGESVKTEKPAAPVAAKDELVKVFDYHGDASYVRQSELDRPEKIQLRRHNKDGERITAEGRTTLNRENIDTDGSKAREAWKDVPLFEGRDGRAFPSEKAAIQAVQKHGQNPADFEIQPTVGGFVAVRKTAAKTVAPVEQSTTPTADHVNDAVEKVAPEIDPLDAELDDALGHLGDVLGDIFGGNIHITGTKHTAGALLPALSKVIELLVKKGARSFAAAVSGSAKAMRANAAIAPHMDQISARQWKAAYNAIAEYHEGTDSEEAIAALPAADVLKLVAPAAATDKPAQAPADKEEPEGATPAETEEIGHSFDDLQESSFEDGWQMHHLFDAPAKTDIVRLADKSKVYHAEHGWMTVDQAKTKIDAMREHALAQGRTTVNSQKVVLSLFDLTGKWSQPWEDAGYNVFRFDIQNDEEAGDVHKFSAEFFNDWFGAFEGMDIHAILAACPCTEFAVSGARHFAAKDADGRTLSAVDLVQQTLNTIEFFKPSVWAIENPVGRIERLNGLPPWRLSFNPNDLGDPYTKKTLLWGRFNADLPIAPVEPTEGSKMHTLYGGKSQATKNARSATPEGFSYGFFMANNAVDHPAMTLANKFDRLDPQRIERALKAGISEDDITHVVEDPYYMDIDDDKGNAAIDELIAERAQEEKDDPVAETSELEKQGERAGLDGYSVETPSNVRKQADKDAWKKGWFTGRNKRNTLLGDAQKVTVGERSAVPTLNMHHVLVWSDERANKDYDSADAARKGMTQKNEQDTATDAAIAALPKIDQKLNRLSVKDMTDAQLLRAYKELPKRRDPVLKQMKERGIPVPVETAVNAPVLDKPALFAELRARLSPLSERAMNAHEGKLSGRIGGFTVGMRDNDANLTQQWVDEVVSGFEKIVKKAEKDAGITPAATPTAKKPVKADESARLRDNWGVAEIDGYTELPGGKNEQTDYGLSEGLKDAYLADAHRYLRQVSLALQDQGFEPYLDAKGKPVKNIAINNGGPAVSGNATLTAYHPGIKYGIYVHIGDTAMRDGDKVTQSGIAMMMRVGTEADHYGTKDMNRWMPVNLTAGELAEKALKAVQGMASTQAAAGAAPAATESSPAASTTLAPGARVTILVSAHGNEANIPGTVFENDKSGDWIVRPDNFGKLHTKVGAYSSDELKVISTDAKNMHVTDLMIAHDSVVGDGKDVFGDELKRLGFVQGEDGRYNPEPHPRSVVGKGVASHIKGKTARLMDLRILQKNAGDNATDYDVQIAETEKELADYKNEMARMVAFHEKGEKVVTQKWNDSPFADRIQTILDKLRAVGDDGMAQAIDAGSELDFTTGKLTEEKVAFREEKARVAIATKARESNAVEPVEIEPMTFDKMVEHTNTAAALPRPIVDAAVERWNEIAPKLAARGFKAGEVDARHPQVVQALQKQLNDITHVLNGLAPRRYQIARGHKNVAPETLELHEDHASEVLGIDTRAYPGIDASSKITLGQGVVTPKNPTKLEEKKPSLGDKLVASLIAKAEKELAELRQNRIEAEKIGNGWVYDEKIDKLEIELADYLRAQSIAAGTIKKSQYGRAGISTLKKLTEGRHMTPDSEFDSDYFHLVQFFEKYYEAGRAGKSMPPIDRHPQEAHDAYNAGKKDGPAADTAKLKAQGEKAKAGAKKRAEAKNPTDATPEHKYAIGDMVQVTPGSGWSAANSGKIKHIKEVDGKQTLRTDGSGRMYMEAKDVTPYSTTLVDKLKKAIDVMNAEITNWSERQYKKNDSRVELQGDGPSNRDDMSIGSINANRRIRAIENLKASINAIKKAITTYENSPEKFLQKVEKALASTSDFNQYGKNLTESELKDMAVSGQILDDGHFTYGEKSPARAIWTAVEPEIIAQKAKEKAIADTEVSAQSNIAPMSGDELASLFGQPPATPDKVEVKPAKHIDGWTAADISYLLNLTKNGNIIITGAPLDGLSNIHNIPGTNHVGYGVFVASTPDYEVSFSGGGAMSRTPSGQGFSVVQISRGEDAFLKLIGNDQAVAKLAARLNDMEQDDGKRTISDVGTSGIGQDQPVVADGERTGTGSADVLGDQSTAHDAAAEEGGGAEGVSARSGPQDGTDDSGISELGDDANGRNGTGGTGLVANGVGSGPVAGPARANYHIGDPESLIGGTPKVRFARNKAAIEAYQSITEDGHEPNQQELDAMAAYIGWGSFGQELFKGNWAKPDPKEGWAKEDAWMREHLGQQEWESAQRSIINAHYTDPITVGVMWAMVRKMGFDGGRVLEPSVGIGNFLGMMPLDLAEKSQLTGIELDTLTGGMAKLLYPNANIQIKGYQDSKTADNFYDLVIGNWPFAKDGPSDRRYMKIDPSLHDFFFLKALDQTRPGGIVIGITSAGTMDKKGRATRMELAKKAELIAAFRLPSGAFEKYAGTAVVTDIIVLRKRATPLADMTQEPWIELGDVKLANGSEFTVNDYFLKHPDHVLGTLNFGSGSTYGRPSMIVDRPANLMELMEQLADKMPPGAYLPRTKAENVSYITNNTTDREGSITNANGALHVVRGDHLVALGDIVKYKLKDPVKTAKREAQVTQLITMRNAYGALVTAERAAETNTEALRKELNRQYKAFVKAYGVLNESEGLHILNQAKDPFYFSLASLEIHGKPAKILTEATLRGRKTMTNPGVRDAFVMARNQSMDVDLAAIAKLSNKSENEVATELQAADAIFKTPSGNYEVADIYLSGNVRRKLREAQEAQANTVAGQVAPDFARNIAALEKVIPKTVPYFQIEAKLGAPWIKMEHYQNFVAHLLGLTRDTEKAAVTVTMINGSWKVKFTNDKLNNKVEARVQWGTAHRAAVLDKMLSAAMNNRSITIKYKDNKGAMVTDDDATKEVGEKLTKLREEFSNWVWKDPERRIWLEENYNEVMNAIATPHFDGSFLDFNGMTLRRGDDPFSLRKHQVDAVWRGLVNGRGLYAHEVGTGKTYTMAGLAVESRRYGLAKKPLILAHNANSASVAREFNDMYPAAKVLYLDNLTPDQIDIRMRQIANDDWDAIVVPHSLISRFALKEETLMQIAAEDIAAMEQAAMDAAEDDNVGLSVDMMDDEEEMKKVRSATAKQLVKARNAIIKSIKDMALKSSKEGAMAFEDLNIDMMIVDEAHEFKKPPIATKMQLRGLNKGVSNMSIALRFLTGYIKRENNGRGIHLFTGTPITNTLTEIYNMMRYIMDDVMERDGIKDWDSWFNTFADSVTDVELTSTGEYESVTRLSAFVNTAELRRISGEFMDIVFADDMPEFKPRPTSTGKILTDELTDAERDELINGRSENPVGRPYKKIITDVAPVGIAQKKMLANFMALAKQFKNASKKDRRAMMQSGHPASPLLVETGAANAGMDPRLVDINAEDEASSKVNRAARNVAAIYKSDPRATQVVFLERGFTDEGTKVKTLANGDKLRTKVAKFNLVKDLVEKLVQSGVKRNEIAIVDGSVSKERRKEIADEMNQSTIRVVIGLTKTLGVGVNMQTNLRAMHHMDAPWMPGELEQRNGRGWRQGNKWNTVLEYRYITEKLDGRRWQVLAIKDRFIKAFLKADENTRIIDGDAVDMEEGDSVNDLAATLSDAAGDPRVLVREKLKADVLKLENRERQHSQAMADAGTTLRRLTEANIGNEKDLPKLEADFASFQASRANPFSAVIDGKEYDNRTDTDKAIDDVIAGMSSATKKQKLGEVHGFDLTAIRTIYGFSPILIQIDGHSTYEAMTNNMASIEATLRNLGRKIEAGKTMIGDNKASIGRMNELLTQPFGQADLLSKKMKMLDDLQTDLTNNPEPAPAWLRHGAPANTLIYVNGKSRVVEGHKSAGSVYAIVTDQGDVPYLDAKNENGMPLFDPVEGDSRKNDPFALGPLNLRAPDPSRTAKGNFARQDPIDDALLGNVRDQPVFYSELARQIAAVPAKLANMQAPQWALWLQANSGKLGIKKDEIAWSGVLDYLALRGKEKVSKDDIGAYLAQNGVRVEEVMKGANPGMSIDIVRDDYMRAMVDMGETPSMADQLFREMYSFARDFRYDEVMKDRGFKLVTQGDRFTGNEIHDAIYDDEQGTQETKYSDYQTPGGESYRELLLTLPEKEPSFAVDDYIDMLNAKYGTKQEGVFRASVWSMADLTPEEAAKLRQLGIEAKAEKEANTPFKSGHWDEPNILAHVRFSDRVDSDGNKVLFIQEIQSDWGQDGKKEGFGRQSMSNARLRQLIEENDANADTDGVSRADLLAMAANSEVKTGKIPNAPFVGKTDAWVALAIKRMVVYGAQNGYDKVAFVNGQQSADLFKLSRYVDSIKAEEYEIAGDRQWTLQVSYINGPTHKTDYVNADELKDHVGAEIAKKIIRDSDGEYTDLDLKVGGEGMKAFYDAIVPQVANDVLKKLGGGKVEPVVIDPEPERKEAHQALLDAGDAEGAAGVKKIHAGQLLTQQGFTITDAMRDKATAGLPLFAQKTQAGAGLDQSLHADVEEGATAHDLLTRIANESGDAGNRAIAQQLLDNGVNPSMATGSAEGAAFMTGRPQSEHVASYSIKKHHVTLYEARAAEQNLLHELTHAGTAQALRKGGRAALQMKALFADVKRSGKLAGQYGISNVDEFVAEAHSNPAFKQALQAIEVGGKSLWQRFVDIVRAALGLPVAQMDALERTLAIGKRLMQENGGRSESNQKAEVMGNVRSDIGAALDRATNRIQAVRLPANYVVGDLFNTAGKVNWWHKTIGTMDNLARRNPAFAPVYDAVQSFIGDVSRYATLAADLAPTLLPQLENWRDIVGANRKVAVSAADTKAIGRPIFEGTLVWARDEHGNPVQIKELEDRAEGMTSEQKAQILLHKGVIDDQQNRAWRSNPLDFYDAVIDKKFVETQLQAGVVWFDKELRGMFGLNDYQIGLYRELRRAIDQSLTNLTISEMVKMGGKDAQLLMDDAVGSGSIDAAGDLLRKHFTDLAQANPEQTDMHLDTIRQILNLADKGNALMERGYAPLMRFGKYTVYVQENDEQVYFGLFESQAEAAQMVRLMRAKHPQAEITHGTISDEKYKLFAGIGPETLELFGSMIGLDTQADAASTAVYQAYLKMAKTNRSAMKRMIQRKGIDGFSEDAGRVLASFIYSNARLTSANAHLGQIDEAVAAIPQQQGELTDAAVQLRSHIKDPQGGGTFLSGLMFAQFLGGSVASAMVNLTQPLTMTLPYLSQYGGLNKARQRLIAAARIAFKETTGDDALDNALQWAVEEGIVAPQEVHYLMEQGAGKGALQAGDGTKLGNARALLNNTRSKVMLGWGKFFAMAEMFNRRITFIAAYRTAVEQGIAKPDLFAQQAVSQTQGTYNSGNKPKWARSAIGGLALTFKQYSIAYLELLTRMWNAGSRGSPERKDGRRAAIYMVAVLFLMAGADGLPFEQDIEDLIDGMLQRMGYNFSTKRAKQAWLVEQLGEDAADFVLKGVSSMPGMPVDIAGRFGMGNLVPGTGLMTKKDSYARDLGEIAGPAGDLAKRMFTGSGKLLGGDVAGAVLDVSPVAARNFVKGVDMGVSGNYNDTRGYKVNEVNLAESVLKGIGFQPASTARSQDARGQAMNLLAQNRLRSKEIAEHWAQGLANRNPDMVQQAREMRDDWNKKNPEARINVSMPGVIKRVRAMRQDALQRMQMTAPKALKATVQRELAEVRN